MDALYNLMDAILPQSVFGLTFMKNALLALLLLTPLLALIGTMAVNRRMAFFSDALGHSALAGVGLGALLGVEDLTLILLPFGLGFALLISAINRRGGASADTNISVFSSTGIALGLALLSGGGSFGRYSSLLVGDVLAITPKDLFALVVLFVGGVLLWLLLYNKLLLCALNPSLAQSRGIRTVLVENLFVCLVAAAVMLSLRWVGILLINALLILPAAAARNIARSVPQHTLFSVLISVFCGVLGLVLAYQLGTSVGAAVVLCAAFMYALSYVARFILGRNP